ncbi:recombinase family protein [Nitrobacter sp. TKz-YC01]
MLNKRGKPIDKGFLYKLINNRVYLGEAVHKGTAYPGEHEAIIDRDLWDKVHAILQTSPRLRAANTRSQTPAMLRGLIFTETGTAMTPTATKKGSKLYRYYTSMDLIRNRPTDNASGPLRLPAGMVEDAVIGEIRRLIATPEVRARVLAALKEDMPHISSEDAIAALGEFDKLWGSLFPAEQARIVQLLVARVTVGTAGLAIDLRHEGIRSLARQMMERQLEKDAA